MRAVFPCAVLATLLCNFVLITAITVPSGPTLVTKRLIKATARQAPTQPSPNPSRLLPKAGLRAKQSGSSSTLLSSQQHDGPAAKAGQFVVLYKPDVNVEAAVASTEAAAATAVAAAVAAGELAIAASATPSSLVTTLRVRQPPAGSTGIPAHAVISLPPELSPEVVKQQLSAAPDVQAVVQNQVVRIAQGGCSPPSFASGVIAQPTRTLTWAGCLGDKINTGLAVFGERCGDKLDKFRWTGVIAYAKATGLMYKDCINLASTETDPKRIANFFSSDCGIAPTLFPAVPTTVCSETSAFACINEANLQSYNVQLSSTLCGASTVTYTGAACGPNNALIQWNTFAPGPSCPTVTRDTTAGDVKKQADWLGQCGVPPYQVYDLPTRICGRQPDSSSGSSGPTPLPTMALAVGESRAEWNMQRVGVFDSATNTVLDPSAAIAALGYKVVTIDTGAEASHPDLNVVEFIDLVDSPGTTYYGKDGNGHGTHVAGIIGARNQGYGVYGVVPGMPIVAYKALNADGDGDNDTVWEAYKRVIARLQAKERISAINLSIGFPVSDTAVLSVECGFVKAITDYGVAVVAAAGNENGGYFGTTAPAACDNALVATALTAMNQPDSTTNVAFAVSSNAIKARMFSAPGGEIFSTYNNKGFKYLTGTSMATPHVTGAYTACVLSGSCKTSEAPNMPAAVLNYPILLAAARAAPCETSLCPPQFGRGQSYYGYTVSVRPWRATAA